MKRNLTNADYFKAAKRISCEPEAIKAVAKIESRGTGFYDDDFPTILFERHKFWKNANREKRAEWFKLHPHICNPTPTPNGGYGSKQDQRVKFSFAFKLDPHAAMMACSWGTFQELGENYDDYGFHSVGEFVDVMKSGAAGHLEIFVLSIIKRGLSDELRRRDWRGFARNYNGANYERFNYHSQMAAAYKDFKAENIDWDEVTADNVADRIDSNLISAGTPGAAGSKEVIPDDDFQPPVDAADDSKDDSAQNPASEIISAPAIAVQQAEPAKTEPETLLSKFKAWYLAVPAGITAYISAAAAWAKDAPVNLIIVLLAILGAIVVVYIAANLFIKNRREARENELKLQREKQSHELTVLQAKSAMDKALNTIQIVPVPIQNSDS